MEYNSGIVTIERAQGYTPTAGLPTTERVEVFKSYYAEKTAGVTRYYTAMNNGDRVDLLIEINPFRVVTDDYAVINSFMDAGANGVYRVIQAQSITDADGLPRTQLSLQRTGATP